MTIKIRWKYCYLYAKINKKRRKKRGRTGGREEGNTKRRQEGMKERKDSEALLNLLFLFFPPFLLLSYWDTL
jgi:hypothetical protein